MDAKTAQHTDLTDARLDLRIGLLLVHGIGDQRRFDHLQFVSDQIIRALAAEKRTANLTVEMLPGANHQDSTSIFIRRENRTTLLDIHEVWWRDLGVHPNFRSVVSFWLWAVSLAGTRGSFVNKPHGYINPANQATEQGRLTLPDRILLFLKTTYVFVLLAPLSAVLQLASLLPGIGKPALLRTAFTYLSSIQMYIEPAWRQSGTLVDYDRPRRISIQRRFLQGLMVMMGGDYDRWYIAAHSLGSVIAFRGLMYDDGDNARLLTKADLDNSAISSLLYKAGINGKATISPTLKCPAWLNEVDALDMRQALAHCRGLVTYGSPLETFARTWPALVPVALETRLPENFEWINLYDILDIISSPLPSYIQNVRGTNEMVTPIDVCCRASASITRSHTHYLSSKSQKRSFFEWLRSVFGWLPLRQRIAPISVLINWVADGQKRFDAVAATCNGFEVTGREVMTRTVLSALQWVGLLFFCCVMWPITVSLLLRTIGWLLPLIFVLGPEAMNIMNSWIEVIVGAPHEAWIWMLENGVALAVSMILLGFAAILGSFAIIRFVVETFSRSVTRRSKRPAIYIKRDAGDDA